MHVVADQVRGDKRGGRQAYNLRLAARPVLRRCLLLSGRTSDVADWHQKGAQVFCHGQSPSVMPAV
jgi:hypothetical protein